MEILTAPRVLLDGELVAHAWVAHTAGRIVGVGTGPTPTGGVRSLPGGVLAPGLVDLQCNGAFGHDFASADADAWAEVRRRLPELGVTAIVPTIITAPMQELTTTLRRGLPTVTDDDRAARCLGFHVEGPFLSPRRRGAHREDLLRSPDPQDVEALLDAGGDTLAYVTLAPELPGALAATRRFVTAGVRVAIGHSDASEVEVSRAADVGATLVTHLFNAQRPLTHRDAGVVGAGLDDDRLTLGLIADLEHVAPTAVRVAFAAAGERIALVSDATPALGVPPGRYRFGGDDVHVAALGAPPRRADGRLAGSALRLDHAVRNTIACGIDPAIALTAASTRPADALGVADVGRLIPGAHADLVWFDDDWALRGTWVGGHQVAGDGVPRRAYPRPG